MKNILILASLLLAASTTSAAELSCAEQIGSRQAAVLVSQCIHVSQATHPPCNALNSCEMIQSEVDRGCSVQPQDRRLKYCSTSMYPAGS